MLGIDYSFDLVPQTTVREFYSQGRRFIIQNVWTGQVQPGTATPNIQAALHTEMLVGIYAVVVDYDDVVQLTLVMDKLVLACQCPALFMVAIDVEVAGTDPNAVRAAVSLIRHNGQVPVIYTGAWFWNEWITTHQQDFSDVPSWLADYDGDNKLDTAKLERLGPVIGKQYTGTTTVNNVQVDQDVFDDVFVAHNGQPNRRLLPGIIPSGQWFGSVQIPNYDPEQWYYAATIRGFGQRVNDVHRYDFLLALSGIDSIGRQWVTRSSGATDSFDIQFNVEVRRFK